MTSGRTWQELSDSTLPFRFPLFGIFARTESLQAVGAGSSVLTSSDAGQSWQRLSASVTAPPGQVFYGVTADTITPARVKGNGLAVAVVGTSATPTGTQVIYEGLL